jgi:hypothetical protein
MKLFLHILCLCLVAISSIAQQRLEKESKYLIEDVDKETLTGMLDTLFAEGSLFIKRTGINSRASTERFVDEYFESTNNALRNQSLSLRYRQRQVSKNQEKKLVQFKGLVTGLSNVQFEYKFDVPEFVDRNNIYARHPLLGYVDKDDRERLTYELARFDIVAEELNSALSLSQKRQRWYLSDAKGDLLTVSLDYVRLRSFPFHEFTELEIEINENRYTNGDKAERAYLDAKQSQVIELINKELPLMTVDQRSKYEKMVALVENSLVSKVKSKFVWVMYAVIVFLAAIKFKGL